MAREYFRIVTDKGVNVIELTMPAGTDVSEFDTLNQRTLTGIDVAPDDGWILDLAQFSYVGSAALGFMINVRQRVQQGGGLLILCGVSEQIMSTLRASSLGRLFSISESRDGALAAVVAWRASRKRKTRGK